MYKKYFVLIILSIVLWAGCRYKSQTTGEIMECTIFPTGVYSQTYLVKIFSNGKFEITFGEVDTNINGIKFLKKKEYKCITLSQAELKPFLDLQNQILSHNSFEKTNVKKGGWEIILKTGKKRFNFYYGEMTDTPFGKIVDMILKITPLKINIHSWS